MIRFDEVTVTYPGAPTPTLAGVDLTVDEGELALVVGPTGTGKSTLLGAVNGLVPHFTGGYLAGQVSVAGRDTATHPPRDLADLVGVVGQDPLAGFTTDTVEEELAYGMEQLGVPGDVMRRRVEETLDLVSIAELRHRSVSTLSGGQAQRVAIASVLTAQPRVLVLDEPTSALDPGAAEEVLAALLRLVHDLGITALVAEHRLERVIHYADRLVTLDGTGGVEVGPPAVQIRRSRVAPPVVRLGELAGWNPLPLSVRDARQRAGPLRDALGDGPHRSPPAPAEGPGAGPGLTASGVVVRHRDVVACAGVDVSLAAGTVTAIMGRNGSGKSSLLWALAGAGARQAGSVTVDGTDVGELGATAARQRVGLVPQTPADLLYLDTVAAELAQADADAGAPVDTADGLLDRLVPGIARDHHPRDGSEGEKLALALAIQLTAQPPVVLLDEPTRGLDYDAKARLGTVLGDLTAEGRAVAVSTHDVEFVAETADRVVILAGGEVVTEGPTAETIAASPAFAPQVAKILAPQRWLTVTGVADALGKR